MHVSEDAELVRRRGRWLSHKIMEIYVQEVSAVLFMPTLPADVRQNLFSLMHSYPMIFSTAQWLQAAGVPTRLWFSFFQRGLGNRPL